MNLHQIVRDAITYVHSDETCTFYQSSGTQNVKGNIQNTYTNGESIEANWQPTEEPLEHTDGMNVTPQTAKVYLFSNASYPVKGITRLPLTRTGDMIQRADGTWWLVTNVDEDWSSEGWACVTVTQQTEGIGNVNT